MNKGSLIRISIYGILMFVLGVFLYGYYSPTAPVFGKVYYRGSAREKVVALTFDDGPNEPYTSLVLDILAEHRVKATFFLIGYNVELYPEVAKRIMSEGHVIGNHSYSHNPNHALSNFGAKDAILAQERIFQVTGAHTRLYRPPHGKTSPWEITELRKAGMSTITWNLTTTELNGRSIDMMAGEIINKARSGSIILLHDGFGIVHDSTKADKSKTVEVTELVVRNLLDQGYTFVTVAELLGIPPY